MKRNASEMDELNGNGKRGLPKLKEILRRQKQDSEDEDSPDIEFQYEDTDTHAAEIAEVFSYTEQPEFALNQVYSIHRNYFIGL